ncbi:YesL family protein [Jiangella alba]|uniref:Uncharacterized membrane protein YesL n=1 Tax=Jiangella alba TaxID=561176 RepID=A0A1H5PY37_9ACTN|nr:YesL family protein [Jiangella alba]SEF18111.1 Uncharacterized membrane protein YesL [Jiangella alba]
MSIAETTGGPSERVHRWLEGGYEVVLGSLLWLVASLPLITLGPATAALFAVARSRELDEHRPVLRTFLGAYRSTFRRSVPVGLALLGIVAGTLLPALAGIRFGGGLATALTIVSTLAAVFAAGVGVHLFPLLAQADEPLPRLLRLATAMALARPGRTAITVAVVAAAAVLAVLHPVTLLAVTGLAAQAVFVQSRTVLTELTAARAEGGAP